MKGGAGQYFTPRALIQAIVDCIQPAPGERIVDPACGTGGFLLATHEYLTKHYQLDRSQKRHLRFDALRGIELVDGVSRLCAMNLLLHGIGPDDETREPPILTDDALRNTPKDHADVVLTNPPFGKKSSITVVNDEGEGSTAPRKAPASPPRRTPPTMLAPPSSGPSTSRTKTRMLRATPIAPPSPSTPSWSTPT